MTNIASPNWRSDTFTDCPHTIPSALPASSNAPIAKSMSASVSAADICVRMRAWPFGTTGKKKPATNNPRSSSACSQVLRALRLAQHHRNDRRLAGRDSEAGLLDAFAKAARMVFQQSAPRRRRRSRSRAPSSAPAASGGASELEKR